MGFAPPFVTEGALRLPVFDLPPRPFCATNMLVNYVVDGLRGQAAPPYCTWTAGSKPCVDLGTTPVHISANQVFSIRYDEIALTDLAILKHHIPHCVLALFFADTSVGRRGRPEPPFGDEWGGGGQTLRSELSPLRSLPYFPARSQISSPFLGRSMLSYPQLNPVETSVETCIEQIKPISVTLLLLIIIYTVSNVATVSTIFYNFFQHSL